MSFITDAKRAIIIDGKVVMCNRIDAVIITGDRGINTWRVTMWMPYTEWERIMIKPLLERRTMIFPNSGDLLMSAEVVIEAGRPEVLGDLTEVIFRGVSDLYPVGKLG